MPAIRTFGSWLARYDGHDRRVHQLKDAFRAKARSQKARPSLFTTADAVYALLEIDDCLPDWGHDVLVQCDKCWRGDRHELSAREQLALLLVDHPAA